MLAIERRLATGRVERQSEVDRQARDTRLWRGRVVKGRAMSVIVGELVIYAMHRRRRQGFKGLKRHRLLIQGGIEWKVGVVQVPVQGRDAIDREGIDAIFPR